MRSFLFISLGTPFTRLNDAISSLVRHGGSFCDCVQLDDFCMVSYLEFSIRNEEMMNAVLLETDTLLQYGEDLDNEDKLPEEDFETVDQ